MSNPSSTPSIDLHAWLGHTLASPEYAACISSLGALASLAVPPPPEIKPYSDAVYLNYLPLGISCMFVPVDGYAPPRTASALEDLEGARLKLESLDVYNPSPLAGTAPTAKPAKAAYAPFPCPSYTFTPLSGTPPRPPFAITPRTTGKEFVQALGEPGRKGGGGGPKLGNIEIWCEWADEGVMVEFEAGEPTVVQSWEKGGEKVWKVMTVFERGKSVR